MKARILMKLNGHQLQILKLLEIQTIRFNSKSPSTHDMNMNMNSGVIGY